MTKTDKVSRTVTRAPAAAAPPAVHNVLRTPGIPLDTETREALEPYFKHDFGKVRVHADGPSAESARAVRAAAYTIGNDVVFGAGRYAPNTARGHKLIAHELTHVVQQSHSANTSALTIGPADSPFEREAYRIETNPSPAPRSLQRAPDDDEWSKNFEDKKTFVQVPYEEYKKGVGDIRPTSQGGLSKNTGGGLKVTGFQQTPAAPEVTVSVLKEIFPHLRDDLAADEVSTEQIEEYCTNLNTAFRLMKIDTVEAQAYYLAHAFVESDQFRLLTEVGDGPRHEWDRTSITPDSDADRKYYNKTYPRDLTQKINPFGNAEFIGRGPVQVTGRGAYLEALALIEKAADDYEKKAAADPKDKQSAEFAALARRAAKAIKADPAQAADPEFTFLFSAAFLKAKGGDVSRANKDRGRWTGSDPVGGGDFKKDSKQDKALQVKAEAYRTIFKVLLREAKDAGIPEAAAQYKKLYETPTKAAAK